jgi:queuosine precursor transporter
VLNVAFQLVCDATAGKIILLFGTGVSVTVLYFPFVYIVSDVVTEVYGYGLARTVLWYTVIASMLAGIMYQLAVAVPAAPFFEAGDAYRAVFGVVPRVLLGSWLALFTGEIANNYVLARMKVRTRGRFLWARTIGSTFIGQLVNTAVFYLVALSGVLQAGMMLRAILVGWLIKTAVEVVMTPVTYLVVARVKSIEGVDVFDDGTDFNPFIMR